jgi:hypothetical protein
MVQAEVPLDRLLCGQEQAPSYGESDTSLSDTLPE